MDSNLMAEIAAEACEELKARDIKIIRIDMVSSLTDWILITEGLSDVQVRAIIKCVQHNLKEKANRIPLRIEGLNEAKWALLDYGELIVNVFQKEQRNFYNLESFWSNGEVHTYATNDK